MGGHYYRPDGTPMHDVVKKDMSGVRKTTVKDAKIMGLYPSVTTYLDAAPKQALIQWLVNQPLEFVYDERDEDTFLMNKWDFLKWAKKGSESRNKKAPNFGSAIHSGIDKYAAWIIGGKSGVISVSNEIKPFMRVVHKFFQEKNIKPLLTEKRVISRQFGYAGTLDCVCEIDGEKYIIDWKTTKFRKGEPRIYFSWGCQLAAYLYAHNEGEGIDSYSRLRGYKIANVLIDSLKPGGIVFHEWANHSECFDAFKICRDLWCSKLGPGNGWDPSVGAA